MIFGSQVSNADLPEYFYWGLIRKYIIIFGNLFADIIIQRTINGIETQDIKVPLRYAAKEKMLTALAGDPDLDKPSAVNLPQMAFEIRPPGIIYDPARKVPNLNKKIVVNSANNNSVLIQYASVPYEIYFNLYIYVKNAEDGAQLIEQIIPFFTPEYTMNVNLIPEMNDSRDIPVILQHPMGYEDLYDQKIQERRVLVYTLPFKMKVWFYGPVRPKPVIKFVILNERTGFEVISAGETQITQTVNSSITSITLAANGSAAAGIPTTNGYYGKIDQEIVYVTAVNGKELTVQRGAYGSTANSHYSNAAFYSLIVPQVAESINVQPTLDANGNPTPNVNNSINVNSISISSDYGFGQLVESELVT